MKTQLLAAACIVALIGLAGPLSAGEVVLFRDTFNSPDSTDVNAGIGLPGRQSGPAASSTYGGPALGGFSIAGGQVAAPAGGTLWLDHNFAEVVGKKYRVSVDVTLEDPGHDTWAALIWDDQQNGDFIIRASVSLGALVKPYTYNPSDTELWSNGMGQKHLVHGGWANGPVRVELLIDETSPARPHAQMLVNGELFYQADFSYGAGTGGRFVHFQTLGTAPPPHIYTTT